MVPSTAWRSPPRIPCLRPALAAGYSGEVLQFVEIKIAYTAAFGGDDLAPRLSGLDVLVGLRFFVSL